MHPGGLIPFRLLIHIKRLPSPLQLLVHKQQLLHTGVLLQVLPEHKENVVCTEFAAMHLGDLVGLQQLKGQIRNVYELVWIRCL